MKDKSNFISSLWERRVPQYLGTYFAVGFGLLQFLQFAESRYGWSGIIVDKYLLIWLLLIPAISILIYFNGKLISSKESEVAKWPKYIVFSNIALALLFVGLQSNNNVSAQNEIVELTDEDGKEIKVVVPALNRIKTLACFQFINESGDDTLD